MLPTSKSDDAKQPKQQQQPQKITMTTTRTMRCGNRGKCGHCGNKFTFKCCATVTSTRIILVVCPTVPSCHCAVCLSVCRGCSCAPCCVVYSGRGLCLCYTLLRFCDFAFPFPVKSAIKSKSGPRDTARLLHFAVE